ncbi:hypothetical protein C8F01DRAFT_1310341 [Mycena amicta]|nr:hypothetical protein C8F01DRAFT_1310341 [Mycena amicta]
MPSATNRRFASTRTVRMLALQNTKIPGDERGLSLAGLLGLNKPKKAPRRVAVQPRRERQTEDTTPTDRQLSMIRGRSEPSARTLTVQPRPSNRIRAQSSTTSAPKKPYLYDGFRAASIHTSDITTTHQARPLSLSSRRWGMAVFSDDVRAVLDQLLCLEGKDEKEERLLMKILEGEVAGGTQMYERVKMVPISQRVDASARWMDTLF